MQHKANVNLHGPRGSTPLTLASEEGHVDVIQLICIPP